MKIRFKSFIAEASVNDGPKYESLDIDEAIDVLNKNCKDARWMLENNIPFYRGTKKIPIVEQTGFGVVDTSATERKSENTLNYYTVIFDNSPYMKEFPKRSRSFIGTTDVTVAADYSTFRGTAYALIPFDGTKIGYVNASDIWRIKIELFGESAYIDDFNKFWDNLKLAENIESFIAFGKQLKAGDTDAVSRFKKVFTQFKAEPTKINFIEEIFKAYSPAQTGFTAATTATVPDKLKHTQSEIWVGGKVVIINNEMWQLLKDYYANK